VGGRLDGQPQLDLGWLERALPLEVGQHVARAGDHPAGQAGQGRNVDPVRAVGASRNDAVEETDGLTFLEDLDALVAYARQALRQRSQLVVVRREQRAAPESGRVVKVLDDGLRDG